MSSEQIINSDLAMSEISLRSRSRRDKSAQYALYAVIGAGLAVAVPALLARTAQCLSNGVQLNSVPRAGVTDPIMEPETEPGRPGQRSIHSLRSQPGDLFAGESATSQ